MKKLILGIFISFSAFFLMSHNASALMTTFDMTQYTPVVRQVYNLVDCTFVDFSSGSGIVSNYNGLSNCGYGVISSDLKLTKIITSNQITFKKNDIVEFDVVNYWGSKTAKVSSFSWRAFKPNDVTNFYMMGYDNVLNVDDGWSDKVNQGMRFRFFVQNDVYTKVGLLATDVTYNPIAEYIQDANGLRWNIINLTVYRKTGKTSVNEEQEEATQDAVDDSETSGSNSQNSSQGATNNLLSVFSGFANVITNATATNCVINAPLNTTFSNDRLNVDLCGLSIPPAIGALTSIIAVMAVVPFALSMFNKFIGIMQGFQR